jgi:hypothetical protein
MTHGSNLQPTSRREEATDLPSRALANLRRGPPDSSVEGGASTVAEPTPEHDPEGRAKRRQFGQLPGGTLGVWFHGIRGSRLDLR